MRHPGVGALVVDEVVADVRQPLGVVILDGEFSDHAVGRDGVERALQDYAAGRFILHGETLRVDWTTPEESSRLRQEAFEPDE